MSSKGVYKNKYKKNLQTTLGKAAVSDNNERIDFSHVRTPIDTSIFGLRHALSLYDTATEEVKKYITYECDIMYECRICRTIFRSLANFVLHKRNYCQEKFSPIINNQSDCEEHLISCVNKEVPETQDNKNEKSETAEPTRKLRRKNLNSVLEKLNEKQICVNISEEDLNGEDADKLDTSTVKTGSNKIHLEAIEDSTVGVFQSFNKPAQELMKTEAMEIHHILNTKEAILGSDGKVISFQMDKNTSPSNIPNPKLTCAICNLKFSTKKTLTYHIKYKHNNTRMVYICPECKDSFANAWCVFRHLYKVHRKTTTQIRKLRDQIHSSAILKKQETEIKKKCKSDEIDNTNKINQWTNDFEMDSDLQMCGTCGKRFERKAALNSHSQLCMKRLAASNIKDTNKSTSSEEKSNKQKPCNAILKGSKKRKSNISRKTRRHNSLGSESEDLQEHIDNKIKNDENKLSHTKLNESSMIEVTEDSFLNIDIESTEKKLQSADAAESKHQKNEDVSQNLMENKEEDVEYKRTAIKEIIFGSSEKIEETQKVGDTSITGISEEEDTLGFPPVIIENTTREILDKSNNLLNYNEYKYDNKFNANTSNQVDENTNKTITANKIIETTQDISNHESVAKNEEFENKKNIEIFDLKHQEKEAISANSPSKLNIVTEDIQVECTETNKEKSSHTTEKSHGNGIIDIKDMKLAILEIKESIINNENSEKIEKFNNQIPNTTNRPNIYEKKKGKANELLKLVSSDHLYTSCTNEKKKWTPNILRLPKKKRSVLNHTTTKTEIAETVKISSNMNSVSDIKNIKLHNHQYENMLSTDLVVKENPNVTNIRTQSAVFDSPVRLITEAKVQNIPVHPAIINDDIDLNLVMNKDLPNDLKSLDQIKIENEQENDISIHSLYNNDFSNYDEDNQHKCLNNNKEELNEALNVNLTLHCHKELAHNNITHGQKRKHSISNEQDASEISLELKSQNYIDSEKLMCVPCNFSFISKKHLMRHMSLHFSWFRFQCSMCTFMSYDKLACSQHSKIHNESLVRNIVMPIPNWKTVSISTHFCNIDSTDCECQVGLKQNTEDVQEQNINVDERRNNIEEHSNKYQKFNKQDPSLRKMIMEVIFGSDQMPSKNEVKESKTETVRPVRSRTVVPNFRKDFVYDMKQIDIKMKERKSSLDAKIKPFKIVKSTDTNFKVVHIGDSSSKKRKGLSGDLNKE